MINEHLPGESILVLTVVCTITLSVIAHGVSANPLARALAAYQAATPSPGVALTLSARWYWRLTQPGLNTAAKAAACTCVIPLRIVPKSPQSVGILYTSRTGQPATI